MLRLLVMLSPLLLLLATTDAEAQPDRRRRRPPPHLRRPGPPPPGMGRPCRVGSCTLTDLVDDVASATDTQSTTETETVTETTVADSDATTTTTTSTDGTDSSSTSNATALSDFPNDDSFANVTAMLEFAADHYGIPLQLMMATGWTESKWTQWNSDGTVLIGGHDYGLMQINKDTWSGTYDWDEISSDVRENIHAGATILKWSYDYAASKGYTGDDLAKAAYAVYNGGPDAVHRPWDTGSAWRQNDLNFEGYYSGKPWESNS